MSKVVVGSDLHIGHENIYKFRSPENKFPYEFSDETEHREWLFEEIGSKVKKRDTLIITGDCCFTEESLQDFHDKIHCRKVLVKGNHDVIKSPLYNQVFDQIHGLWRYKGYWLSHAPIHPEELRGKINIHGHTHYHTLDDDRYMNICVEHLLEVFHSPIVEWSELMSWIELRPKLRMMED